VSINLPYSDYYDSDIGWLGKVPAHWNVTKLKHEAPFQVGWTPPTKNDANFEGHNLWANISDLKSKVIFDTAKRISDDAAAVASMEITPKGSLLYSFKLSVGAVAFAGADMYTNEAIASFLENDHLSLSYLYYAFPIFVIQNAATNIYGARILNQDLIKNADLLAPPFEEASQIAKFLDYETAKIDGLIEKQQQLIALLKEKRQAVISHAVTKGLNPAVPMRHSGIEWLGEVPAHWDILAVRHALKIDNGPRFPINRVERAEMAGPYPYWGPTGVLDHINHYRYEGNRTIIGEDGDHFLKFAIWPMTHWVTGKFNVNNHAHVVADGPKCSAKWFYYSFLHRDIGGDVIAQGVSRLKLTREGLSKLVLAVPPLDEQSALIAHIEPVIAKVEKATIAAEQQIELLQERRTALISAAVTGKIDVRGWEPPPSPSPIETKLIKTEVT
jgi:type I restriction enzyme S subunit